MIGVVIAMVDWHHGIFHAGANSHWVEIVTVAIVYMRSLNIVGDYGGW